MNKNRKCNYCGHSAYNHGKGGCSVLGCDCTWTWMDKPATKSKKSAKAKKKTTKKTTKQVTKKTASKQTTKKATKKSARKKKGK